MGALHFDHVRVENESGPEFAQRILAKLSHFLPHQAHIKDFVHQNTLQAFQDLPFHQAIAEAQKMYGVRSRNSMRGNRGLAFSIDDRITPLMIRLSNQFFDQGLANWSLGSAGESFWVVVKRLATETFLPLIPLNEPLCQMLLAQTPEDALYQALGRLVQHQDHFQEYLWEVLMLLPGWAGFVHAIEKNPRALNASRTITMTEWVAILLILEVGFLIRNVKTIPRAVPRPATPDLPSDFAAAHDGQEWTRYRHFLAQIRNHHAASTPSPVIQAVFCIDDRYANLRYFIEQSGTEIETFGGPGFFGIDCWVAGRSFDYLEKRCPVPVVPENVILKVRPKKKHSLLNLARPGTPPSALMEWLRTHLNGLPSGLNMLLATVYPEGIYQRKVSEDLNYSLVVWADQTVDPLPTGHLPAGLRLGFTYEEAATRVRSFLESIGLTKHFAPLIAIVAHGASSVNNPYFAAYDCGACAGRPGGLNARIFCMMANHPTVRTILADQGFALPKSTVFVPFIHDTTADQINRLSNEAVDPSVAATFDSIMDQALNLNAQHRSQRFAGIPRPLTPIEARKHVYRRSVAWYEPRPEYNHATNFACVIGQRALTKGVCYPENVFLQSYDFRSDASGEILRKILLAVIPVCGGINLEYLFSRIDPDFYGAGSKLPQNVTGLFGVLTGIESDLRSGLPTQMTEIHDPLRLLCVIEQSPAIVQSVLARLDGIQNWIQGEWIWVVCHDPVSAQQLLYRPGKEPVWQPISA